jgi:CDP-ribitol ribitolphosphotransferase / teichoic acid ribitol-phosphate polymerase
MKCILFCENPYAFAVLAPIRDVLKEKDYDVLWYLSEKLRNEFPYPKENNTSSINKLSEYKSDVIFVPGNEVPHFLRGVKTQVFHGLAGEKKGHFRIRHYFDLYLSQGPYFTERFMELSEKHKNFEVIETGWSKLDVYGKNNNLYNVEKETLLEKHKAKNILLYAPTFSPSLTSAPFLKSEFEQIASNKDNLILFKFHDLMQIELIDAYKELATKQENIVFVEERNILKFLLISDLMISDTSSVVYEFLLLNKPVITLKARSPKSAWDDIKSADMLTERVKYNLDSDPFAEKRAKIIADYHPYNDGMSSLRMVEAVENYIHTNGVPDKRKLSFFRRYKINKIYK